MCARVYCKFEQLVVVSALLVECCSKIKFKLAFSTAECATRPRWKHER